MLQLSARVTRTHLRKGKKCLQHISTPHPQKLRRTAAEVIRRYAEVMQKLCRSYAEVTRSYAEVMQRLRGTNCSNKGRRKKKRNISKKQGGKSKMQRQDEKQRVGDLTGRREEGKKRKITKNRGEGGTFGG